MARVTREEYLDTAESLFAERGFYGVSIAAIADQLGLTKQALLHHFGSKEKLYGEVLRRISERFETLSDNPRGAVMSSEETARTFFLNLHATASEYPDQSRLLMRELLDNNQRAASAGKWYLKPFLENLIAMMQALPAWKASSDAQALAAGYQLLGAINYYSISEPTLSGIFGSEAYEELDAGFPAQLRGLIDAVIATGAPD
ncbi:MAG: TetR/AcrR family transcriptional regulator [Henriciella sp.]|nr:TetR/AcrR family transcriptional regulator [Henriciella sp.]